MMTEGRQCIIRRAASRVAAVVTAGGVAALSLCGCGSRPASGFADELKTELSQLADSVKGTVGIAYVGEGDTVTVNNGVHYPMMSVFKLHQALAVADAMEHRGASLDSVLTVRAAEMDRQTWSPMLKVYGEADFTVSVGDLMRYALVSSDNNASNLLFERIVSPEETDRFVRSVASDTTFNIAFSEHEMKECNELAYVNWTSPLSAALLIKKVFEESVVADVAQDSIRSALIAVTTGYDRLGSAVVGESGVLFGHKTGSGYRNEAGELVAHNDVGYFRLPDGRSYSLAVFIRDFSGSEAEASEIIARISGIVRNRVRATADDR